LSTLYIFPTALFILRNAAPIWKKPNRTKPRHDNNSAYHRQRDEPRSRTKQKGPPQRPFEWPRMVRT
jgi:hypothetical protein